MDAKRRLHGRPLLERLAFRTVKQADGCWLWTGAKNTKGYGHIRSDGNGPLISVHRVAYQATHGLIPDGAEIDHLCFVRNCVNPAHLEAVDHATNIRRGRHNQNHGKTHCIHGHEFDEVNIHIDYRGRRRCRTCTRLNMRRYRAARAAA